MRVTVRPLHFQIETLEFLFDLTKTWRSDMRNIVSLCAAALALASPGIAQADTFGPNNGTYAFSGPVTIQKGLAPPIACNLALSIVVTGVSTFGNAANVNAGPVLSGGPICPGISLTNLSYSVDAVGTGSPGSAADELWFSTVRLNIPFLPGVCQGVLKAYWLPGLSPQISFAATKSDLPGPPACVIIGTLTQVSGSANLDIAI
ncbi:hypothetical protein [Sphingopyxis sp. R3-92]|uniref:hypothetical protein n=1 Tax=Sphingopyxis sp. R3-92 TaxID=3158553 RepID=UPI003EE46C32